MNHGKDSTSIQNGRPLATSTFAGRIVGTMLYESEKERTQHEDAIKSIVQTYNLEEEFVKQLYEQELHTLKPSAKIKTYLTVLITRLVKDQLNRTAHTAT